MKNCPGCLKAGHKTYCEPCRKRLFGSKKVSHILPFSRPAYDQAKLAATGERLSISGIQTKMSVAFRNGQLALTDTGGQYILKPIPYGAFRHSNMIPVNEHLTMQIARQVFAIAVAENVLVEFNGGEVAYLVRRFDVQEDGSRRLQEDFAQIASRSEQSHGPNYKYDFSYEEIGDLIRRYVAAYPVAMERFFQLVVFNHVICNSDAHLKNFSLIRNEEYGDYTLTPAYDLLNTRLHVSDETRTALPLFKNDFETESYQANAFYAYDDFQELAKRLELHEARFARIMRAVAAKESEMFILIDRSELSGECKELYKEGVRESIRALSYSYAEANKPMGYERN